MLKKLFLTLALFLFTAPLTFADGGVSFNMASKSTTEETIYLNVTCNLDGTLLKRRLETNEPFTPVATCATGTVYEDTLTLIDGYNTYEYQVVGASGVSTIEFYFYYPVPVSPTIYTYDNYVYTQEITLSVSCEVGSLYRQGPNATQYIGECAGDTIFQARHDLFRRQGHIP